MSKLRVINEQYVASAPSLQNAVDIFKGRWVSIFPPDGPVTSGGTIPLFGDGRITWLLEHYGGTLAGKAVAELGPFEGGHSYMLVRAGADRVHAIEANTLNFAKTLIVKEVFGLNGLTLACGEIETWLAETEARYDLLVASGVLYHFHDPLRALYDMTRRADHIFIWTHFVHEAFMPRGDRRLSSFTGKITSRTVDDFECKYYQRSYDGAESAAVFCGGVSTDSHWLSYDAIVNALRYWGFDVEEALLEPDHANGPSACFFATRAQLDAPATADSASAAVP